MVDEKLGRVLGALGDAADPGSLRSRTVIARFSDHGELGLSHGGLRQKMFNAYEETIRVPLVVSNPVLFPRAATSDALVSLVDLVPTLLSLAGAEPATPRWTAATWRPSWPARRTRPRGARRVPVGLRPAIDGAARSDAVRDDVLFTYDDHQAGTAFQDAPGQPNRIRCVRDRRWKYAVYLDPRAARAPEYELYDLEADPTRPATWSTSTTGRGRTPDAERERRRLHERLARGARGDGDRGAGIAGGGIARAGLAERPELRPHEPGRRAQRDAVRPCECALCPAPARPKPTGLL